MASSTESLIWSAHLVGVALGDRLRREREGLRHHSAFFILRWTVGQRAASRTLSRMMPASSVLGSNGSSSTPPSASTMIARLVSTSKPGVGLRDVVPDDEVEVLGAQIARPRWPRGPRSRRRTRRAPGPAASPARGRSRSRASARGRSRGSPRASSACGRAAAFGRKSAIAAAITMTSCSAQRAMTASCISAAVCTDTISRRRRRRPADGGDEGDRAPRAGRRPRPPRSPVCPTTGW